MAYRPWISVIFLVEAALVAVLALGAAWIGLAELSDPSAFLGQEFGIFMVALGACFGAGAVLVVAGATQAFGDGRRARTLALSGLMIAGLPVSFTVVGAIVPLSALLVLVWRRPVESGEQLVVGNVA